MNYSALEQRSGSGAGSLTAPMKVAILLSTYNGERFLVEQLDSLLAQTHRDWVIYASDDGSIDSTPTILREYQQRVGEERFFIFNGPRQGFAKNFMSLVKNPLIVADYFAFCDQDDVWLPNKVEKGLALVAGTSAELPVLYCTRTHLIDEAGESIGFSPLFSKSPGFANALVRI